MNDQSHVDKPIEDVTETFAAQRLALEAQQPHHYAASRRFEDVTQEFFSASKGMMAICLHFANQHANMETLCRLPCRS